MSALVPYQQKRQKDVAPKNYKEEYALMGVSWGEDANPLSIFYLIGLVRRRLGIVVAVALAVGALCTLFALTRPQQFESTALLVVDSNALELTRNNVIRQPQVDTEVEILRGINIIVRLAARLKSESETKEPASVPRVNSSVERIMKPLGLVLAVATEVHRPVPLPALAKLVERVATGASSTRDPQGPALESTNEKLVEAEGNSSVHLSSTKLLALQKKFTIRRRGLTDVIAIDASAKTPERAAKLANLYAEVYLDEQVSAKLYSIERVEAALTKRIAELKTKLAQAGAAIKLRELYSDYLARLAEVRRRRSVIMPDLRIAAPALPLERQSFPSPRLLILLGWLFALGLAVAVAFLRDRHSMV